MYCPIPKLLLMLIFYLYLTIHLIKKIVTYFTMIYFINKKISNTTYNLTCLNKYFEYDEWSNII
jgi:hypothetical protein